MAETSTQTPRRPAGSPTQEPPPGASAYRAPHRRTGLLLLGAVTLLAAALRLWDLGDPGRIYFDEVHYANDAHDIVTQGVESNRVVHPPVGKLLMAAGIAVLGFDPVGWRIIGALAGTLTVTVTQLIGTRLTRSVWLGALAGVLVAVDGLAITSSRIAMLDVFLALFVTLAAGCTLLALDQTRGVPSPVPGPAWWAGGLCGLAVATKWSGLLALAATGVVLTTALASKRWRAGARPGRAAAGAVLALALPLGALPAAVYVSTYTGWFLNWEESSSGQRACEDPPCRASPLERVEHWARDQVEIAQVHGRLEATHPYRSSPTGWPVLARPVLYYLETCYPEQQAEGTCEVAPGNKARILGVGNPGVWWPALLAYPLLGWRLVRRKDPVAGYLLAFLVLQYVPWYLSDKPGYLFYTTPLVPMVALAGAYAAGQVARRKHLRAAPALLGAVAVAAGLHLLPLWVGTEMPAAEHEERLWFSSWR